MMQENVIPFKKTKLFINGVLVNLENAELSKVDILVENGIVSEIKDWGVIGERQNFNMKNCEIVDLQGNLVMLPFVNAFCDSEKAVLKTYGRQFKKLTYLENSTEDKEGLQGLSQKDFAAVSAWLMKIKNVLAGSVFENDMWLLRNHENADECDSSAWEFLENLDEKSETELDGVCMNVNQNKLKLFLKIGQTLNELGSIDKHYVDIVARFRYDPDSRRYNKSDSGYISSA